MIVSAPLPPLRSSAPAPPSILVGSDVFASTKSLLLCISNESVFSGTPGETSVEQATWTGEIP